MEPKNPLDSPQNLPKKTPPPKPLKPKPTVGSFEHLNTLREKPSKEEKVQEIQEIQDESRKRSSSSGGEQYGFLKSIPIPGILKSFLKPGDRPAVVDLPNSSKVPLPNIPEEKKVPECTYCKKVFPNEEELSKHVWCPERKIEKTASPSSGGRRHTISTDTPPSLSEWSHLDEQPWFFEHIDRVKAEELLKALKPVRGSFLVRKSSVSGVLALSLYDAHAKKVSHTLITPKPGGFALQDSPTVYASVEVLIQTCPECKNLQVPARDSTIYSSTALLL